MKESREVFKGTSNFEELTAEQQEVVRENFARFFLFLIEEHKKETRRRIPIQKQKDQGRTDG
jgi:hypothetical protein